MILGSYFQLKMASSSGNDFLGFEGVKFNTNHIFHFEKLLAI